MYQQHTNQSSKAPEENCLHWVGSLGALNIHYRITSFYKTVEKHGLSRPRVSFGLWLNKTMSSLGNGISLSYQARRLIIGGNYSYWIAHCLIGLPTNAPSLHRNSRISLLQTKTRIMTYLELLFSPTKLGFGSQPLTMRKLFSRCIFDAHLINENWY